MEQLLKDGLGALPARRKNGKVSEHTNWVFTCHQGYDKLEEFVRQAVDDGWLRYCVGQVERAPSTGKEHFQGYLQCTRNMSMGSLCKRFADIKCHWAVRRGTHEQARDYVTKEETRVGNPILIGIPKSGQGQRTDLEAMADSIMERKSIREVALEHPTTFIKYHKGAERLLSLVLEKPKDRRRRTVQVQVFYGPSGTGKTRRALWENPDAYCLNVQGSSNTIWFDGYFGQSCLLIDEFRGQIPYGYLLSLIDPHPSMEWVQVKGGQVPAQWTKVVITSNLPPNKWYSEEVLKREGGFEGGPLERRTSIEGELEFMAGSWKPPIEDILMNLEEDLPMPSPIPVTESVHLTEQDIDELLAGLSDIE